MPLIFAYGSLLNPKSISKTIKRNVSHSDMQVAVAQGYYRTWTARTIIQLESDNEKLRRTALFLDLSSENKCCNGAIIKVSKEELEFLKIREFCYELIKLKCLVDNKIVDAVTFMIPTENKSREGLLAHRYLELVNEGLQVFDSKFKEEFWNTTEKYTGEKFAGNYIFINE